MQVHFENINIVSPDKLFVLDNNNNEKASYSDSRSNIVSPVVDGEVIKLKLVTDNKDTAYGFKVDRYMAVDGTPGDQDTTPPAGITNIFASEATPTSVKLIWTAPGDDGNIGTAMFYDIRYSTSTINDLNWAKAAQFQGEPVPKNAGTAQTVIVSGLSWGSFYYFGIKSYDDRGAASILSNITIGTTSPAGCSLSNGKVDLNTGTANTTVFTYSVLYNDSNNQAPKIGYPKIHILLGEKEVKGGLMSPVDFMDTTYTDGKAYQYKGSLPYSGQYSFWFEAFNKDNKPARTVVYQGLTVSGVNVAPNLLWTGEVGYENDGINPNGVDSGKECVYKVKYTDANNDPVATGYPKVSIYNPSGQLIGSVVMKYESGSWSTGAIYRLATLTSSTAGRYSYKFEAKDVVGATAMGSPVATNYGPTVSGAPVLNWIGGTGYEKDGINPEVGIAARDTVFIYQVKYTDPDGDKPYPGYPQLHIYKGGVELAGESPKSMIKVTADETDAVYKSGVIYKVEYKFPIGGSDYTYNFEATDRWGVPATGEPASRLMDAPDVNNPPFLEWSKMNDGYMLDGVDPDSGQVGASFTFTVKYSHYDNDAPAPGYPKVAIFAGDVLFGSFTMALVDPSANNYKKGKLYTYSLKLSQAGSYSYQFVACDVKGVPAIGEPIKKRIGPIVSTIPVLSWLGTAGYESDGVSPDDGTKDTVFTFKVKYTNMFPPAANLPRVIITSTGGEVIEAKMSGTGTDYAKGVEFNYATKLSGKGIYSYSSRSENTIGMMATGTPVQIMSGPRVKMPPGTITTLVATNPATSSVKLTWTAPGDDGSIGTATQYDIRYATVTITDANWNNAVRCVNTPAPGITGIGQSFVVTGLQPYTRYYFAMKTRDEVPNWSGLSNVAVGMTILPVITITQVIPPNGSVSFTTLPSENRIRCTADIKPDSLDAGYNNQIEWEIDDDPRDSNPSGNPNDIQRGNDVQLQITMPPVPADTDGRGFPLSYRIVASVVINNATYTSVATYTTQDEMDQIRQEYIDMNKTTKPARTAFVNAQTYVNPGHFVFNAINWSVNPATGSRYNWAIFTIGQHLENIRAAIGNQIMSVNSGYRSPIRQLQVNPTAPESRHIYGDAVDIGLRDWDGNGNTDELDYWIMRRAAEAKGAT